MKKTSIVLLFLLAAVDAFAQQAWTIETVPNTRLRGNDIHVSDPDDYLSDSAEATINAALCTIRDTADVFLVTLRSIGEEQPKRFATKLFNRWGIGDAAVDNGVLLLFVEDQHALEFETGYGAEATLTDARCAQIFKHSIVPHFRSGDYEGGLCAGVADIVSTYGREVPTGLMTLLPEKTGDEGGSDSGPDIDDMGGFTALVLLMMLVLPFIGLAYWVIRRKDKLATDTCKMKTEDSITYLDDMKSGWNGSPWVGRGCAGALMFGCSLFVIFCIAYAFIMPRFPNMPESRQFDWAAITSFPLWLTWMCFRQGSRTLKMADTLATKSVRPSEVYRTALNHRSNKVAFWMAPWLGWYYRRKLKSRIAHSADCRCPHCHAEMEQIRDFTLPETHAVESRIGALSFKPCRCANGHTVVLREKGKNYADFATCDVCGAYTLKKLNEQTLRKADYTHSGEKEVTYECQHCAHTFTKKIVIPMLVHSTSSYSSSSSGSSYSSRSSSRSSGGSFGGGRSGGGGFSGRW